MRKTNQFILILLFTFTFSSFAQTDTTKIDLANKWALQFQIAENFTLSSFQGSTLSGKYHFSNNSALRLGFTINYSSAETSASKMNIFTDTTTVVSEKDKANYSNMRINLQYVQYFNIVNSVAFFYGGGVSYYYYNTDNDRYDGRTNYDNNWGLGIDLLAGVEWFVRSNMGISAEYGIGYSYLKYSISSERKNNDYTEKNEANRSITKTIPTSVKFGISIYF